MSSDVSSNAGSDVEEVVMYRCRHCPGEEFTAAERDLHRQQHRQQGRDKRKSSRAEREGSPTVTLFEVIPVGEESDSTPRGGGSTPRGGGKSPRGTPIKKKPGPKSKTMPAPPTGITKKQRKIRSDKKFDRHVEAQKSDGG